MRLRKEKIVSLSRENTLGVPGVPLWLVLVTADQPATVALLWEILGSHSEGDVDLTTNGLPSLWCCALVYRGCLWLSPM